MFTLNLNDAVMSLWAIKNTRQIYSNSNVTVEEVCVSDPLFLIILDVRLSDSWLIYYLGWRWIERQRMQPSPWQPRQLSPLLFWMKWNGTLLSPFVNYNVHNIRYISRCGRLPVYSSYPLWVKICVCLCFSIIYKIMMKKYSPKVYFHMSTTCSFSFFIIKCCLLDELWVSYYQLLTCMVRLWAEISNFKFARRWYSLNEIQIRVMIVESSCSEMRNKERYQLCWDRKDSQSAC